MPEHAVIIHLLVSDAESGLDDLSALEERLTDAIEAAKVGEFDGNEVGGGEYVLFMYGPDAERLFAVVRPVVDSLPPRVGSYAILRWGRADDPHARQERRAIGTLA
jgi:hypothetical protein